MTRDLTVGKAENVLWKFSLPMFISVVFQQLYNMADSIIAGRFAGEDALAAIGASYPITMIFIAVAIGSNAGCSVVISTLFGAKDNENMKTAISTTLISSLIFSVLLTVAGFLSHRQLMRLVNTPDNIFSDGALYLLIFIYGLAFLFMYNVSTGIFTAVGDSKTPLIFLIISSVSNIFLDWLFVAVFHRGVAGVAWATFIAQGAAAICSIVTLLIKLRKIKCGQYRIFSFSMLKRICSIAVPSIIQQSFVSVGNIFIQSIINRYGSSVIAGYSAAVKLNTFTITSLNTLSSSISTFTAQNIGAQKYERVKKGFKGGLILASVIAVPFMIAYIGFGNNMINLFLESESKIALQTGRNFLLVISPFYLIIAAKLISDGVLRGAGAIKLFMTSTFTDLILRVVLAFLLSRYFQETGVWMAWSAGWVISAVLAFYFYKSGHWKRTI